jgi:cyclic beta-1,2-glucan synthetase
MQYLPYAVIAILVFLYALALAFSPRQKAEMRELKKLSDEDFALGVRNLSKDSRIVCVGGTKGVVIEPLFKTLLRAERLILKKIVNNKTTTAGERWFYENVYHIKRFTNAFNSKNFAKNPHGKHGVRVLSFARYILENSYNAFTRGRVRDAVRIINSETPLIYREIMALKDAFNIAIAEQLFILAKRIIHFEKMQKRAARRFSEKHLNSDIYIKFLLDTRGGEAFRNKLINKGVNPDAVEFNYSLSVVETGRAAKYLFETLKALNETLNEETLISMFAIDKELGQNTYYKNSSIETKKLYLSYIAKTAENTNISEFLVTKKLTEVAEFNQIDPILVLADHQNTLEKCVKRNTVLKLKQKSSRLSEKFYIACVLFGALAAAIGSYFIFLNPVLPFLVFLPAIIVSETVINAFLNATVTQRPLPRMSFQKIPIEHSAMVVISMFITSAAEMKDALVKLKSVKASNKDQNITAALLVDLKAGGSEVLDSDLEIINACKSVENCENLCVFIRKRTKIGEKFQAYEKKRGAMEALCDAILNDKAQNFSYISNQNFQKPQYIIALDADNVMDVNGAKALINTIAHPANARYDLVASRPRYNLFSLKTFYAKRFLGESAYVNYPSYQSLYFNLFGKDVYTGKGIFRVKSFYDKLNNLFPDNKILSHDIIEGAVLNTAADYIVYEDAPLNFAADRERKKRWMRGDIQLLPFTGLGWKTKTGEKHRSNISPVYKFLMLRNVINILAPLFVLTVAILAIFNPILFYLVLFLLFTPLFLDCLGFVSSAISRKMRMRYALSGIAKAFFNHVHEAILTPFYALANAVLFFKTCFAMLRGKNLLNWKTFSQSQGEQKEKAQKELFSPSDKEKLKEYALKTYGYFKHIRVKGSIIADNLQIKPYKGMSETSSPTNIGFDIIAEICAYYLGFSQKNEITEVLSDIIIGVENLEKWHGNLYNWYYVTDNSIAVPFVSSVDSGNFVACLIILKEFLYELSSIGDENAKNLIPRVKTLIKNTKLNKLYDGAKRQFYLGYNAKSNKLEGNYDLLASESRLLSFVYIALSGDSDHWKGLVRDFTEIKGNTLFSWSGTMFEYLMPDLFLDAPKNSLLKNSSLNAVRVQMGEKIDGLWGISESGYYAFDEFLRYQYTAFGVDKLALGKDKQKSVISPYSTLLALPYAPKACIKNLQRLQNFGAYGEHGFYEAVDLQGGARILNSHMTHHQGMGLMSLTNCLTNGKLKELMLKDSSVRGATILLTEPQENRVFAYKVEQKQHKCTKQDTEYSKNTTKLEYYNSGAGITDGELSCYFNAQGGGFTMWNKIMLNPFTRGEAERGSRHFYLFEGSEIVSPTQITFNDEPENYAFSYSPSSVSYFNRKHGLNLDVTIDANLSAEINKLTYAGGRGKKVAFYEPLSLTSYEAYNSHPAFSKLFVNTEHFEAQNAIVAKRYLRKGEKPVFAALVVKGLTDITFETNRFNFIGRLRDEGNPLFFDENDLKNDALKQENPSFGDVLEPCFAFKAKMQGDTCEVIKIFASSREALIQKIAKIPDDYYSFAFETGAGENLTEFSNSLLQPLMAMPYKNETLMEIDKKGLRNEMLGVTQGRKVVCFNFGSGVDLNAVKTFLITIKQLRYFGVFPKVYIILNGDLDNSNKDAIMQLAQTLFLNGVTVAHKNDLPKDFESYIFIKVGKNFNIDLRCEFNNYTLPNQTAHISHLTSHIENAHFDENNNFILPLDNPTSLPYSNVIGAKKGGFIATENGGGVIFAKNCRENRITCFDNDPVKDTPYERIFIETDEKLYRINGGAGVTNSYTVLKGEVEYASLINNTQATLKSYVVLDGKVKINEIKTTLNTSTKFVYALKACLGADAASPFIYVEQTSQTVFKIKNLLTYQEVFIKILGESITEVLLEGLNETAILSFFCSDETAKIYIALGSFDEVIGLNFNDIPALKAESLSYFNNLGNVTLQSPDAALNQIFNFLPYQVVSSRLNARCGYYQLGGATGYRDQLQDVLALLHCDAERVRKQIIYHAEHQYLEGDVQHWWHSPKMGLRTKISDDKLFLPFAVAEYIKATGDKTILHEKAHYLVSPQLAGGEHCRYENPELSDERFAISDHCMRAINSALVYGKNGLLLMGTGDWNDGMDYIGERGIGESVPLTMFAYQTIVAYAEFLNEREKQRLLQIATELKQAVETKCYDGRQYIRLFGDDNLTYGLHGSNILSIDLLSQSFAALSGIASDERVKSALKEAESLIDEKNGIIKLLAPALTPKNYLGYISAYPQGVRENGGQYTHATMWYLMALARQGDSEKAYKLFDMVNPAAKHANPKMQQKYKGEPYVMPADIYAYQNAGRMGWNWYTGSAAWAYKLILEEFYGVKRINNKLYIEPNLPKCLNNSTLTYKTAQSEIKIDFIDNEVFVNGEKLNGKFLELQMAKSVLQCSYNASEVKPCPNI